MDFMLSAKENMEWVFHSPHGRVGNERPRLLSAICSGIVRKAAMMMVIGEVALLAWFIF